MNAKFHSAPGHSTETTLIISLPPRQSVRARIEREREERDRQVMRDREDEDMDFDLDEGERQVVEREREIVKDTHERVKTHSERSASYKDKFQKMREKYDRVTATQEIRQRDLDILNGKIRKLQSENDFLLDSLFFSDPRLYNRYFAPSPGSISPPPEPRRPQTPPHSSRHAPPSQSPRYSSNMPPPHTSTSASQPSSTVVLPPLPGPSGPSLMPSPSANNSNGALNTGAGGSGSSQRHSVSSRTRSRRRSDVVHLAPEDDPSDGNARRTPTPTQASARPPGAEEDLPIRSPRVNGNASPSTLITGSLAASASNGRRSLPSRPEFVHRNEDIELDIVSDNDLTTSRSDIHDALNRDTLMTVHSPEHRHAGEIREWGWRGDGDNDRDW